MKLYVRDRRTKWRIFYGLPTNVASIRILPPSQAVCLSQQQSSELSEKDRHPS